MNLATIRYRSLLASGMSPEQAEIRLRLERRERLAQMPEPEIELNADEKPCKQHDVETPADQPIAQVSRDLPERGRAGLGLWQRASLGALMNGPLTLPELITATGGRNETVREGMRRLRGRGFVRVIKVPQAPGVIRYKLTDAGRLACG